MASIEDHNRGPVTLEHFALKGRNYAVFRKVLEAEGVAYEAGELRSGLKPLVQVNIHDPDGNHIHLDFPLTVAKPG